MRARCELFVVATIVGDGGLVVVVGVQSTESNGKKQEGRTNAEFAENMRSVPCVLFNKRGKNPCEEDNPIIDKGPCKPGLLGVPGDVFHVVLGDTVISIENKPHEIFNDKPRDHVESEDGQFGLEGGKMMIAQSSVQDHKHNQIHADMVPCPPQKCTRGGQIDRPPVFALHFHLHPGPEGGEHDDKYHIIGVHPLVDPVRFRRCWGVVRVGIDRQISRLMLNHSIWHFYLCQICFIFTFHANLIVQICEKELSANCGVV